MYVTLNFDVEDHYSPEEWGANDFIKFLADSMHAEGVKGSFLIIGDKLRSIRDRGRPDLIESLAKHEIGSHTDRCNHPGFPFDYLSGKGWAEGVAEAYVRESAYADEIRAITGVTPSCLSFHGADVANCAAQLIHASGRMGLPFVYSVAKFAIPSGIASYANTLTFCDWFGGFERVFHDDAKFEDALRRFDEQVQELKSVRTHAAAFVCHPNGALCPEHVGIDPVANGVNVPERDWLECIPRFDSPEMIERAKHNFVRLVRHVKAHPDLELTTYAELASKYSAQPTELSFDDLLAVARQAVDRRRLAPVGRLSAAEAIMGFAACIGQWRATGQLPDCVRRQTPLGPLRDPMRRPCYRTLSLDEIVELSKRQSAFASSFGHLPADLRLANGRRLGLGATYLALAQTVAAVADGRPPESIALPGLVPGCPDEGIELELKMRESALRNSGIADPNLSRETIIQHARLQTWTLRDVLA